jgi:hypothetical protein
LICFFYFKRNKAHKKDPKDIEFFSKKRITFFDFSMIFNADFHCSYLHLLIRKLSLPSGSYSKSTFITKKILDVIYSYRTRELLIIQLSIWWMAFHLIRKLWVNFFRISVEIYSYSDLRFCSDRNSIMPGTTRRNNIIFGLIL